MTPKPGHPLDICDYRGVQKLLLGLRQKKAHEPLAGKLFDMFKRLLTPGQPEGMFIFPGFGEEHINFLVAVNRPTVPGGSTEPSPEQRVYVYVPFPSPL